MNKIIECNFQNGLMILINNLKVIDSKLKGIHIYKVDKADLHVDSNSEIDDIVEMPMNGFIKMILDTHKETKGFIFFTWNKVTELYKKEEYEDYFTISFNSSPSE